LLSESTLRTGHEWLQVFGFGGPPGSHITLAEGVQIGFEVPGDRDKMLAGEDLLARFNPSPPETETARTCSRLADSSSPTHRIFIGLRRVRGENFQSPSVIVRFKSARGLAQSKTLREVDEFPGNASRLGLRRPSAAFPPSMFDRTLPSNHP